MSYIDNKVPPTRDTRLKICAGFGGSVEDLLGCSKRGCVFAKDRSFSQTGSCQMYLSLAMVMTIPDSVTVLHGPVGCGSHAYMMEFPIKTGSTGRGFQRSSFLWISTNLGESDIIGGGEQKLKETVQYVDTEFHPRVIFVVSTCAPNIIGDDLDEICDGLRNELTAKIVPLHCPGFKTRVNATAYDTVYHGLAKNLEFEPKPFVDFRPFNKYDPNFDIESAKYKYKKSRTVNLFNASAIGVPDEKEVVRLLTAMDLKVNISTEYSSLDDFRLLSEASLNISMCTVHDDYLLDILNKRYGTPCLILNMPIGIQNTGEWLRAIAKKTGDTEKVEAIIKKEEADLMKALEPMREKIKGKRVLLNGGVIRVACMAVLLKELGAEVLGVRPYHYDSLSDPIYERLAEEFPGIDVNVASNQVYELVNIIKREKPDLVFAHPGSNAWVVKAGSVWIPLFAPAKNYLGYRGVYDVARSMVRSLRNPSFSKNAAERIPLPFRKDWYAKNPYSYIAAPVEI
ncbi:MAG: nitrogenase [Treponema sp.]|jgi:nitrogenase molybdenum-iron protein alpha chain|nr:nitrogenase [Treponema sp.]